MANETMTNAQRLEALLAVAEMAARGLKADSRDLAFQEEKHAVDPAIISQIHRAASDRAADLGRQWARARNPHYRGR